MSGLGFCQTMNKMNGANWTLFCTFGARTAITTLSYVFSEINFNS